MSRRLLSLAALATALLAPAAHAQSPVPPGMDPGENAKLAISELDSLNVVLEPADFGRYAELFTGPIKPLAPARDRRDPERPLIDFKLHSVGGTMETWTDLRGEFCGQKGWFNNATAVQDAYLYGVSRATGYPKWHADPNGGITLNRTATKAVGEVKQLGETIIKLEWRQDARAVRKALAKQPWRRHWLQGDGFSYTGKAWTYEGAGDAGPFVKEVHTDPRKGVKQDWDSRVGMVRVTVNPPLNPLLTHGDWAPLVPKTVEVPGMLEDWNGTADFYGKSLTCGLQGSTATEPPKGVLPEPPGTTGAARTS